MIAAADTVFLDGIRAFHLIDIPSVIRSVIGENIVPRKKPINKKCCLKERGSFRLHQPLGVGNHFIPSCGDQYSIGEELACLYFHLVALVEEVLLEIGEFASTEYVRAMHPKPRVHGALKEAEE